MSMFRWLARLRDFFSLARRPHGAPRSSDPVAAFDADPVKRVNALARAANWETRADPTLAFKEPKLNQFRELWHSVARSDRLPSRAEFTARLLKPYLVNLSILEIATPDGRRFVHRYVGTAVTERLGPSTGLSLAEFLPAEALPRTVAFMDVVVESRRPLRILTRFQLSSANFLIGEIFAAPLAEDGVRPDRLLTISYFFSGSDTELIADLASFDERYR